MSPTEGEKPASESEDYAPYRIAVSNYDLKHSTAAKWVTAHGEWDDLSQQLHLSTLNDTPEFVDFFSPPPATTIPVAAPSDPLQLSAEATAAIEELRAEGSLVSSKVLRARTGGRLLVCSAVTPHTVRSRLRPLLGESLHVTQSPWTLSEFKNCATELELVRTRFKFIIQGTHVIDGRNAHVATPVSMTTDLISWAGRWTPGLLELRPWIRPLT